jgi:hypothetical protein
MQTERGKAFEENEPELTAIEIDAARNAGKYVVSFKGMPVLSSVEVIGFLAVKFALSDGSFTTIVLDRLAAEGLWTLIDGPKKLGWRTDALRGGPSRH